MIKPKKLLNKRKLEIDYISSLEVVTVLNSILDEISYQPNLCIKNIVKNYLSGEKERVKDIKQKISRLERTINNDY